MPVHPFTTYRSLFENHRYREAAAFAAKTAAALPPAEGALWFCRQAAAELRNGKNDRALAAADNARTLAPDDQRAKILTAEALLLLDRIDEAHTAFLEARTCGTDSSQANRGIIDCLIRKGNCSEGLAVLQTGGALPAENVFFYTIRLLSLHGRYDEAIALCDTPPPEADAVSIAWVRCILQLKSNDADTVLARYRNDDVPDGSRKTRRDLLGYIKRQCTVPADEKGRKNHLQAMKKSALTLAKSGRGTEALPQLEDLLLTDPADPYLNNTYVAASRKANLLHPAIGFYRRLGRIFPEERCITQRLAHLQIELGELSRKY